MWNEQLISEKVNECFRTICYDLGICSRLFLLEKKKCIFEIPLKYSWKCCADKC